MIRYKSRRDVFTMTLYIVGILASIFIIVLSLIAAFVYNDAMSSFMLLMGIGIVGAFLAALLCNLFTTEYRLFDDVLEVKGGFSRKHVTYKQIYALQRTKKIFCFNALAREKLEVIYRGEGKRIYISPKDEASFIKDLKKYCKNLQIRDYQ